MSVIRGLRAALPLRGSSSETWGGGSTDLIALNLIYIGDDNPSAAEDCCYEEVKDQHVRCTWLPSNENERTPDERGHNWTFGVVKADAAAEQPEL